MYGMNNIHFIVKKTTDWNPTGIRTPGGRNDRWRDEVINDIKKLKLGNCSRPVKDRKACNDLVQKTKQHVGLSCHEEEEEKNITATIRSLSKYLERSDFRHTN
jgi:hypothetical protein